MTKILATAAGLALAAGAMANPALSGNLDGTSNGSTSLRGMTNTIIDVNISGVETFDGITIPYNGINTVLEVDLAAALGLASGSSVTMTSIGWDTTQTTFGGSWLSEMQIYFDDNINPDGTGLFLRTGFGSDFSGTGSFSSGGQIDLSDNMIPNLVLANGILRLEFGETFIDNPGAPDGIFDAGSFLRVGVAEVPAPGAAAVLGLAGLAGIRRRR
jgi:MYXO-CTERM domain-containing protein